MERIGFYLLLVSLFISATMMANAGNPHHKAHSQAESAECVIEDNEVRAGKSSQSFAPLDEDDVSELVTEFRSDNAIRRGNARQIMGSSYSGFFEPASLPDVESAVFDVILCCN